MLNRDQIKLVQCAARGAGLRGDKYSPDGRYYLLLGQYKQRTGKPVDSCKQLTRAQMEDFLAICESMGWQHPGKEPNHYQKLIARQDTLDRYLATDGQKAAIKALAGDLGMNIEQLKRFLERQTKGACDSLDLLTGQYAWRMIEALKAMLGRRDHTHYSTLAEAAAEYGTQDTEVTHEIS